MSITSGPIVPESVGNVIDGVPSLTVRVAVWSVMSLTSVMSVAPRGRSGSKVATRVGVASFHMSEVPQASKQRQDRRIGGLSVTRQQIPQIVVAQVEQPVKRSHFVFGDRGAARIKEAAQDQIVLEHAPPAAPPEPGQ